MQSFEKREVVKNSVVQTKEAELVHFEIEEMKREVGSPSLEIGEAGRGWLKKEELAVVSRYCFEL